MVAHDAPPSAEEITASRTVPFSFWCSALSAKYTRPPGATAPASANQYRLPVFVRTGLDQVRPSSCEAEMKESLRLNAT